MPEDWLRDGERGKVLKNMRVEWKTPKDFCLTTRPLGKSERTSEPTWLYDDSGSLEDNQTADDVQQGSLGDCYFLSALALATRDKFVCSDLIDDSLEAAGIYGVSFWTKATFTESAKWMMVWVDSFFPCYVKNDGEF